MATAKKATTTSALYDGAIHAQHFETDQYVRVYLGNGRTEIGVVSMTDGADGQITVTTRHGYDVTVRPNCVRRAFLIVLDLNGVLGARGRGSFIHRPHVEDFVKFVFSNFVVAVWTSGLERSCSPIIDSVFRGYRDKLLFTLYRDACTSRSTPANPYGTVKNLQRIFDTYPKSFHSVNTIIIDDSPDKCSHPDIALCPVPFRDPVAQREDDGLLKVIEVLDEVLQLDSHLPLIRVAEERARRLEIQQAAAANEPLLRDPDAHDVHGADGERADAPVRTEESCLEGISHTVPHDHVCDETAHAASAEVQLWKTRLCCDYLRGVCRYGTTCRFSHDADDGKRPCNHKDHCTHGHAARWVTVTEEAKPTHAAASSPAPASSYSGSPCEKAEVGCPARPHDGTATSDTHHGQGWAVEHLSTLLMTSRTAQPTANTTMLSGGHFVVKPPRDVVVRREQAGATGGAVTSSGMGATLRNVLPTGDVAGASQGRHMTAHGLQSILDLYRGNKSGDGAPTDITAEMAMQTSGAPIHITASANDERSLVKQLMRLTRS